MSTITAAMNNILNPVLHQVIGSTPEGIKDSIIAANLRGNSATGAQLAALAIFAASVNKKTMEEFASKDAVADTRPVVRANFTINNVPNMTALTLLGHCLLTSSAFDGVAYVVELRRKMGARSLWDGDLNKEGLSEKQFKIYAEKKRKASAESARLLGVGYAKYTGIDSSAFTAEEETFWNVRNVRPAAHARTTSVNPAASSARTEPTTRTPAAAAAAPDMSPPRESGLTDEELINRVPADIRSYYTRFNSNIPADMANSIRRRGLDGFITAYRRQMTEDPNGLKYAQAGSVAG